MINGEWILEDLFSRDFVDSEINESKSKIWKERPSDKDMKRLLSPKYLSILELRSVLKEEKLEFKLIRNKGLDTASTRREFNATYSFGIPMKMNIINNNFYDFDFI